MKKDPHMSDSLANLEAEDELFGEAIDKSADAVEPLEVMESHDLSESSAARASRLQIAKRNSAHAGIEFEDRIAAAPPSDKPTSSNLGITVAVIAFLVLAGLYVFTIGADDGPAERTASTEEAPVEAPAPGTPVFGENPDDKTKGDGTPSLPADVLVKGMVASGWRVSGQARDKMDEVVQTTVLAEKDGSAASVTIYESGTWEWADQLKLGTEPPSQAIGFGRTIVRISPGPDTKSNGVLALRESLEELKSQAREKLAKP